MALSASTAWETRSTGSDSNSGGFNVGNANFAADLAATVATGTSPVVTSASYTFVAGDVGYWLFVKSGTNWVPGWYQIASVSAGAATLSAAVGAADLYGGATLANTAAGCATTASPTGGTWSVDYSIYQDAARFSFTDMVIDGTTNTKFTSAAKPVGVNMVGNLINVASGTGFTVQFVEVVSVSGTTATCDKGLGTLSSTGGTGAMGGALATLGKLAANMVTSNVAFAKGSFTKSATGAFTAFSAPSNTLPIARLVGYTSRRGDGGRATVTLATNTGLTAIHGGDGALSVENWVIDCASLGTSTGIYGVKRVLNCWVKNFTLFGMQLTSNAVVLGCEVSGGGSSAGAGVTANSSGLQVAESNIHNNACPGIVAAFNATVYDNLVTNNTGASSDGIRISFSESCIGNTVYGSGRHGINNSQTVTYPSVIRKNILASNGGYGFVGASSAGLPASAEFDGNAYWNNTSGTRNFADDVGATNAQGGVAPYVNSLDVILTADPFVSKATGDFRLNNNVGGGAACRGHGVPASWPGNSLTTSAPDMGAAQHADAGGGLMTHPGMTGRMNA